MSDISFQHDGIDQTIAPTTTPEPTTNESTTNDHTEAPTPTDVAAVTAPRGTARYDQRTGETRFD